MEIKNALRIHIFCWENKYIYIQWEKLECYHARKRCATKEGKQPTFLNSQRGYQYGSTVSTRHLMVRSVIVYCVHRNCSSSTVFVFNHLVHVQRHCQNVFILNRVKLVWNAFWTRAHGTKGVCKKILCSLR